MQSSKFVAYDESASDYSSFKLAAIASKEAIIVSTGSLVFAFNYSLIEANKVFPKSVFDNFFKKYKFCYNL